MKIFQVAVAVAAVLTAFGASGGCGSGGTVARQEVLAAMGNPPAFGSAPAVADWGGFLEGRWGMKLVVDEALSKRFGLDPIREQAEHDEITEVFTFARNGTFVFEDRSVGHKLEGQWSPNSSGIQLSFATLDGKPLADALAEAKRKSETGLRGEIRNELVLDNLNTRIQKLGSFSLSGDRKNLAVYSPSMLDGSQMVASPMQLVRLAR